MKKKCKIFILPLVLMLLLTLAGCKRKTDSNLYHEIRQTKTMTWGVKADTRLFGLMSIKTGKIQGFEVDLANALTKKMLGDNAKANFVQTTSKTRIPMLKNGNIDAILATMTITPDRKKQVDFTNSYFLAGQSLLVPDKSSVKNVKDLNGKTVLAVKGTTAVADVKKYAPRARVLEYDDYGQAFTALKAGQGQALTTDNGLLAGIASENPGYKLAGGAYTEEPYGIAVNKGQKDLADHLNQALAELKADGTYQKLVNKWFSGIPGFNIKEAEGNK